MGDVRQPDVRVTMIDKDVAFVDSVLRFCARVEPAVVIAHITDIADLRAHSTWSRPDVITLAPEQLENPAAGVVISGTLPTHPAVIALTMLSDSAVAAELAAAGALGWVDKQEPVSTLVDAIRAVHRGEARYPTKHLGAVMRVLGKQTHSAAVRVAHCTARPLTGREQEVLTHLLNGATPGEIARLLHLSTNTVRSHRRRIEAKLGVRR
jgi:DNA-binding NarL/FixJ family response regulator